jgi:hypothetical protein
VHALLGNPAFGTVIFRFQRLADLTRWSRAWGHLEEEEVACRKSRENTERYTTVKWSRERTTPRRVITTFGRENFRFYT